MKKRRNAEKTEVCCFESFGHRYRILEDELVITRNAEQVAAFSLAPEIEGRKTDLTGWRREDGEHFSAGIRQGGRIHLALEHGYPCFWMETERDQFETLTYFPESRPAEKYWQTYLSDEHDRKWDVNLDAEVLLSSSYQDMNVDGEDGQGMTDPGDKPPTWIWNIPVRCLSFQTGQGWLGLSIPGPLPVGVTRLKMIDRKFSLTFQKLRPACREGMMPRIYFAAGLAGPYDALVVQREISRKMGLMVEKSAAHPTWWSAPSFKPADEIFRQNKGWFKYDKDGKQTTVLSTDNCLKWLSQVRESLGDPAEMTFQLDQLYFYRYGGRKVVDELGGATGLRRMIDSLRKEGIHTGLYIHLYMIDRTDNQYVREHPEMLCRPKDPNLKLQHGVTIGAKPELAYVDWTHPLGRKYMLDHIRFLISSRPGCLNADWLLINNNLCVDPRKYDFHDPDWGIGDLMHMKIMKLVYQEVKKLKPQALVRRQSPADCYMQPYLDHCNCCEEWNGYPNNWYRRAQIATRTMDNCIFTTDAWFVTVTKSYEYFMAMLAWITPEIESVTHAIHPYMHHRELKEKDFRRRRSGIQTYLNAPVNITDECRVTWREDGTVEAWRKYTRGPLQGFYAALALSRKCLVTYSAEQALVAAAETRRVEIPLPGKAAVSAVEMVPHEGKPRAWPYTILKQHGKTWLETRVEDCGFQPMYFRIKYRLPK